MIPQIDFDRPVLIAGGGGFIGGHLIASLYRLGFRNLRVVDIKPLDRWYQVFPYAENISADLTLREECDRVCDGIGDIYNLACNMGGMGFIENHKALCMISVLINTHLLQAASHHQCGRYFFASSACVYNAEKQVDANVTPLKESDAYPAMPEDGYGWEKLFSERMCRHFQEDFGMDVRIARFHNVYGPLGTWQGGREKAPAAICRKVLEAKYSGIEEIEIWGDGNQTRSFTFIDDCTHGIDLLMRSNVADPINLGSSELVTINGLVDIVEEIANVKLNRSYKLDAPKGVNGRNSDNTFIQNQLGWAPATKLRDGMEKTFRWIEKEFIRQKSGEIVNA
ncbi:MAG: NAD-dependent epimerase/dehydratase family protein [Aureliella sp.]